MYLANVRKSQFSLGEFKRWTNSFIEIEWSLLISKNRNKSSLEFCHDGKLFSSRRRRHRPTIKWYSWTWKKKRIDFEWFSLRKRKKQLFEENVEVLHDYWIDLDVLVELKVKILLFISCQLKSKMKIYVELQWILIESNRLEEGRRKIKTISCLIWSSEKCLKHKMNSSFVFFKEA